MATGAQIPHQENDDRHPAKGGQETPERATYVRAPDEVLKDVALAASSAAELPDLIERFAALAFEATAADRVSFFLADDARTAVTLWSTTSGPNPDLWEVGKAMEPISLEHWPYIRALLHRDEAVFVPDARASPMVPADWTQQFELASLIIAPLRRAGTTIGLMVADYRRHTVVSPEIVNLATTIGRLCAVAIENSVLAGELAERAEALEALVTAAETLGLRRSLTETSQEMAGAIAKVMGSDHLSVHLIDPVTKRQVLLAQRGFDLPKEGDAVRFARGAYARVARAWRAPALPAPVLLDRLDRLVALQLPPEIRSLLVLPLARPDDELFGFILVGRREVVGPTTARLDVATALAAHVGWAIHQAQLDERVAIGAEFARALLAIHDIEPSADDRLLTSLDRAIPPTIGFKVIGVRLAGGRTDSANGGETEAALWRSWRQRRTRPPVHERDGTAYAPISGGGGRTLGILHVQPVRGRLEPHERDLLEALAGAIGESVERDSMRRAVERRERELALADERAEVADDLHANIGHLLELLGGGIAGLAAAAHDRQTLARRTGELGGLVRLGQASLALTVKSLSALEHHPDGLPPALAAVVSGLAEQLDVAADVSVRGAVRPLPLPVEQALLRVAHEVLSRLQARGRASAIAVRLEYSDDMVKLAIRDDGIGLAAREDGTPGPNLHTGLRTIHERLKALGGSLEIERSEPRGLLLTSVVPV
jgi:signal transduction histidine kinase